jgi:hypothetical protein
MVQDFLQGVAVQLRMGQRNPGGPQSVLYAPAIQLAHNVPVPTRLYLRQGGAELSNGWLKLAQR